MWLGPVVQYAGVTKDSPEKAYSQSGLEEGFHPEGMVRNLDHNCEGMVCNLEHNWKRVFFVGVTVTPRFLGQ